MVALFSIFKQKNSWKQSQVYKYAKKTDRAPMKKVSTGTIEVDMSEADRTARGPQQTKV